SSDSRNPHTLLYSASLPASATTPVRTYSRSGSSPPLLRSPPSTTFGYSAATLGAPSSSLTVMSRAMSRPQERLAAHPHDVAVHRGRTRVGGPGDRLGDVHRQTALRLRGKAAAELADHDRHGRGHLRLDEPGCDGVDRAAVLGDLRRGVVDHADDARLAGRV